MNAWVGDAAKDALGFDGVPQIYVLDAAHRVVFHADGYSTDTRPFDGAVEAVAAGR